MSIINEEADIHFSLRMISEKHDDEALQHPYSYNNNQFRKTILLKLVESTLGI